jgi:uncharacterized protein YlxW (UPF0749 family)
LKGKIAMVITIGVICILLSSVMFLQFKSVEVIEKSGVGAMREEELKTEYTLVREKTKELEKSLEEIEKSIDEYNNQSTDIQGTIELLNKDIRDAKVDLGYTDVKGPGLVITIADGDSGSLTDRVAFSDLLSIINELKFAGAEAISINDLRVVNNTYIIIMNGPRINSPYTIKVIGDTKYLEGVLNIKGGVKEQLKNDGKKISYTVQEEVYINKYNDLIEINYGE